MWLNTCFLAFFSAPMVVLAIFELVYAARLSSMDEPVLRRRGRYIAAIEVVVGLLATAVGMWLVLHGLLGLLSVICGFVLLAQIRKREAADEPRAEL